MGVAPGRLAAAGGNRGVRGGEASPHPSTAYVLSQKRIGRRSPPPNLPPLGGGAGLPPPAGEGACTFKRRGRRSPPPNLPPLGGGSGLPI